MLSLSPNPKQNISYSFYFARISSPLTCQLSLQHLIKVKQFYFIYISSSLQPPTTHSLFFLLVFTFSSFCFFPSAVCTSNCTHHLYHLQISSSKFSHLCFLIADPGSYFIVSFCQFFFFYIFSPTSSLPQDFTLTV